MFVGLFGLGLLNTAVGIVTIGLGIPIRAFNLGNTLILSGTVAVVGGFILIGLAAQIRQLKRLAEMITSRPVARPAATEAAPRDAEAEMPDPPSRAEHVARMTPTMERRKDAVHKDPEWFNVVWPDAQSTPLLRAEPAARDPTSKLPSAPHSIQEKRVERAFERPVAIVKSGVIDGMAFTVYVDGSIEAELPQGIIKFASLDALRAHLQKRS